MEMEKIEARRQEIERLCARVQSILFGKEYPISKEIICDGEFSEDAVVAFVDKIVGSVEPENIEEAPLIRAFLETVVCYLFSECNEEDRIYGSLYKIAAVFSRELGYQFECSTFGIMLSDANESRHYGRIDKKAFDHLIQKVAVLREQFSTAKIDRSLHLDIEKYLDAFILKHDLSCLTDDDKYQRATHEIERLIFRTRIHTGAINMGQRG